MKTKKNNVLKRLARINENLKLPASLTAPPNVASSSFMTALVEISSKIGDGEFTTTQQCTDSLSEYFGLKNDEKVIIIGIANWYLQSLGLVEFL